MLNLQVLLEDNSIIAVNKSSGILVHPMEGTRSAGNSTEATLLSLVREHCGHRVFPVHRIDRATSGVVLFGKTSQVANTLCLQFESRTVCKEYLALVRGWMPSSVELAHPVWNESETQRLDATTRFVPNLYFEVPLPCGRHTTSRYCCVMASPQTGRYHQIRQHLKHLSHPIIGDTAHGDGKHNRLFRENFGLQRLFLHARELGFSHPDSGQPVCIVAPLLEELSTVLDKLQKNWSIVPQSGLQLDF